MGSAEYLRVIVAAWAVQSPAILVCLGACLGILSRWSRLRRAALPALLGFGLALFMEVVGSAIVHLLPLLWREKPVALLGRLWGGIGVVQSLIWAVALGLILIAVFIDRAEVK